MEQKRKWKLPAIGMRITKSAVTDTNPYLFVWNRFLDTMIGIIIGIGVNCFSLPKKKRKDILFISGLDDTLLHKKDNLRKSPYRNYVKREFQSEEGVVYFMMLYPSEIIEGFYKKLEQQGFTKDLKVLKYKSQDYEGYSYLKIYNKNATKENMIHYLKERTNLSNVVTFGSIKGRYDIVVEPGDTNKVVHMLKKLYEPIKWGKQRRKSNLQEQ